MIKLTPAHIEKAKVTIRGSLPSLEGRKVLVVGDVGIDEYLSGDVRRISPEAPVPVVEVQQREYRVGLAANVAQNIQSLGGQGVLVGLVGQDEAARNLSLLLKESGVSEQNLVTAAERPTTRKVRVMSGHHHVVRVDFEEKKFINNDLEAQFVAKVESLLGTVDGVILQDYGKGVLTESLCQHVIELAHRFGRKVVVDPHRTTPVKYYRGADLIKPNKDEAFILSGLNLDDLRLTADSVERVGRAIQEIAQTPNVILTQGKEGVLFFQQGAADQPQPVTHIPTEPRQVYDVTGAGDTYLAAFCLGWFSGFDPIAAAVMANCAAGVVVGKVGSVPCTREELFSSLETQ